MYLRGIPGRLDGVLLSKPSQRIAVNERPYIAIVERAQRGDPSAFAELVIGFQDLAVGAAFAWLGELELARDATQEAFLEAHLHLGELRDAAAFPAWLRRLVVKHCDRVTRRPRVPLAQFDLALDIPALGSDPITEIAARERAQWLRLAVEGLPAGERVVVALHYFAEVPGPALAEFLELPLSTVKKRLRRARARLRREGDRLMQNTIDAMRPSRTGEFAEEVAFFLALRQRDLAQVAQMLGRTPSLVNAQQQWDSRLVHEGVLPFASRATAVLTAIERDDLDMLRLLLHAGADLNGACGCVTGESPVWAAAVLNRVEHVRELLRRGAEPNVVAASGNTPLHVAAMRGHRDVAVSLLACGARIDALDTAGRTPADWAASNGYSELAVLIQSGTAGSADRASAPQGAADSPVLFSGIKALDLFVPIPRGGVVRFPFMAGVGMMVLLGELCRRVTSRDDGYALWAGFAQRPFDVRDWEAEMAELGISSRVQHRLVDFAADPQQRRDAFAASIDIAEAMRDSGHEVLVVLLCDTGHESDIEANLHRLGSAGAGSITTIVVTPFPERAGAVLSELAPPYKAQVVLDRRRARKRLFPSIDPLASLSELLDGERLGARHLDVASRARQAIASYMAIDPDFDRVDGAPDEVPADVARARRLLRYLRQPFHVAEPFTGHPGQWVSHAQLLDDVEAILGDCG